MDQRKRRHEDRDGVFVLPGTATRCSCAGNTRIRSYTAPASYFAETSLFHDHTRAPRAKLLYAVDPVVEVCLDHARAPVADFDRHVGCMNRFGIEMPSPAGVESAAALDERPGDDAGRTRGKSLP